MLVWLSQQYHVFHVACSRQNRNAKLQKSWLEFTKRSCHVITLLVNSSHVICCFAFQFWLEQATWKHGKWLLYLCSIQISRLSVWANLHLIGQISWSIIIMIIWCLTSTLSSSQYNNIHTTIMGLSFLQRGQNTDSGSWCREACFEGMGKWEINILIPRQPMT